MNRERWHSVFRTSYPRHWAASVDTYSSSAYNRYLMELIQGLASPGIRVLDCGVGTGSPFGTSTSFLDISFFGVDLSEELLAESRINVANSARGNLVVGASEQLPFADSSFDLVYCVSSSWFFFDQRAAIFEMGRTLSRGGVLVLDTINAWHPRQLFSYARVRIPTLIRNTKRYLCRQEQVYVVPWRPQSPRTMERYLEDAGLSIQASTGFFFLGRVGKRIASSSEVIRPLPVASCGARVVFVARKHI